MDGWRQGAETAAALNVNMCEGIITECQAALLGLCFRDTVTLALFL